MPLGARCLTPFACQKIEARPVPCRKGIDADIRISDAATNCDCCVDYTLGTVKGSDPWRHLYKDFLCNIIDKGNVIYLVRHELDHSEIIYGEQLQIVLYYGGP